MLFALTVPKDRYEREHFFLSVMLPKDLAATIDLFSLRKLVP